MLAGAAAAAPGAADASGAVTTVYVGNLPGGLMEASGLKCVERNVMGLPFELAF